MRSTEKPELTRENTSKSSKPVSASGCKPTVHPQQKTFDFDDLTLDSCFDSGNMASALKASETHYHVWIAPDCCGTSKETDHRTWFYFRVKNIKKATMYTFTVKNMNYQGKLYSEGLVPVYKTNTDPSAWKRIDERNVTTQKAEKGIEVSFKHTFGLHDEEVYFAFTYPWSYAEDQELIAKYEQEFRNDKQIYFQRELLAYSREQRRIELITITSHSNKLEQREQLLPNLFPASEETTRPFMFDKKYVFISSRVHPGETPASFMFKGLLRFLLSKTDPRAQALRDNFVMVLVPMLNPDGVYRGHYRSDTHGLNLNRFYTNPSIVEHPSIYAARSIVAELSNSKRLFLYCDLHAHATKRGCFVYGNNLEFREQVENMLFPKLLSLNSEYFDFDCCDFSEKNVHTRGDGKNKEGAGRVALYKQTNLVRCYTLEFNYNSGKQKNVLTSLGRPDDLSARQSEARTLQEADSLASLENQKVSMQGSYIIEHFEEVGEGIGPTLLDMLKQNPQSRVSTSVYKSVRNVQLHLGLKLMKEPPYRFDAYLRRINKNVNQHIQTFLKYLDDNVKEYLTDDKKRSRGKENESRLPPHRSSTLPPQSKKRVLRDANAVPKDGNEQKSIREIKVVNIVVSTSMRELGEAAAPKKQRPQVKMIIKKKTSCAAVPARFGSSVAKKVMEAI